MEQVKRGKTAINFQLVCRRAAELVGFSLNQAAAYLAFSLWKLDLSYYLLLVFVLTFVFSIYIKNLSIAIAFTVLSIIIGALITVGILLIPPLAYQSGLMIEFTLTLYPMLITKLVLLNMAISIFSSILGGLLSE